MDFEAAVNGKVVDAEYDAPAVAPQLSLEAVKPRFLEYKKEVARIVDEARALEIVDDQTRTLAVEIGTGARKISKKIEARKKEILEEPKGFIAKVGTFCDLFTAPLGEAVKLLKQKEAQYLEKLKKARDEAAAKAEAERRRLQAEMDKEAKAKGIEPPVIPPVVVPETKTTVRTESGSSYEAKRWVCRVVDPKAVPREYCEPVKKLLDNAVKMGVREITGCVIEEVTERRYRTN